MTAEERFADLERRVAALEARTAPMITLGPPPSSPEQEAARQKLLNDLLDSVATKRNVLDRIVPEVGS